MPTTQTKTILANTSIKALGGVQNIGTNSTVVLNPSPTIDSDCDILAREVELKLFAESDLSTEIGTESNPLSFGTVEAGTTVTHSDNPFVLFNDKDGTLQSVDATELTVSVEKFNIVDDQVGTSDGSAGQSFVVAFFPIIDDDTLIIVKVNDAPWSRVSTFVGQDPTAEVYTINATTGEIIFGDDLQGKIPSNGETIKASYTPDILLFGKQIAEQLWFGVQSNGTISNGVDVVSEQDTPTDTTHVQARHAPSVSSVDGVFLITDPHKVGTNYFTGGAINAQSGVLTLGTPLPDTGDVLIDYTYTIEDDVEGGYSQIGGLTTHTFDNSLPSNNAKRLNFRLVIPSSASPSGMQDVKCILRFTYIQ
jgi:hypothetical protein